MRPAFVRLHPLNRILRVLHGVGLELLAAPARLAEVVRGHRLALHHFSGQRDDVVPIPVGVDQVGELFAFLADVFDGCHSGIVAEEARA